MCHDVSVWNRIAVPNKDCIIGTILRSSRQDFADTAAKHEERRDVISENFGKPLKEMNWLPTSSGTFERPSSVTLDQLPEGFVQDKELASLLGLGLPPDEDVLVNLAHRTGVTVEDLRVVAEHHSEFLTWRATLNRQVSFPERPAIDPERRRTRIAQEVAEAPRKQYHEKWHRVRVTEDPGKEGVDTYLRPFYTEDDRMICQICQREMPFRKRNGQHYYERVEAFDLPMEHEANYLALCPVCAAKYCEFVVHARDDVRERLQQALLNSEHVQIPLILGNERISIRFVETHFMDIKAMLVVSSASDG